MRNRVLSNVLTLNLLVTGYVGISAAIHSMSESKKQPEQEYSLVRIRADQQMIEKNWPEAARYYRQLTLVDPFNGGAHVSYAFCLSQQLQPLVSTVRNESRKEQPDAEVLQVAMDRIKELSPEVRIAYERVLIFSQFQNFARWRLALLHGLLGENEIALEYLRTAHQAGFHAPYRGSLADIFEFSGLRENPDFIRIIASL